MIRFVNVHLTCLQPYKKSMKTREKIFITNIYVCTINIFFCENQVRKMKPMIGKVRINSDPNGDRQVLFYEISNLCESKHFSKAFSAQSQYNGPSLSYVLYKI